MNYLHKHLEFDTVEDGIEQLKKAVHIRNQMGGALYYNITHNDCVEIGEKVMRLAVELPQEERNEIYKKVSELTSHQ